ncbi:GNAT family N-acetyltransferase [Planctobacterium marinum]|uniref:N-acetyltransferase n=1 Tax=Planctobacterium marinum TaxID=1631968 RepID=A0AA48HHR8_9ALTE|nr:N-acetyltransferase [Planctobacterium marinum]
MSQLFFSDYHSIDYDACLSLFDSNCPDAFHPAERLDFEAFLLDLPGPYLLLHHQKHGLIGCGGYAYHKKNHSADLCWGMIHSTYQRQGFGTALLQERLARIRLNPEIESVSLCTAPDTVAYYHRFNFQIQQTIKDGFAPGADRIDMAMALA